MLLRESVVQLEPGSVLAGRFQIRRVLGKGATGVVLEADDRVSRSLVALKVFKPEIASDDRWQEIVGSELRHARQIIHPNVCRVFDAGEAGGYRFLSMEYASGGSLRQRLKEAGPDRTFEERIADARAVVQGLAAIHAAGLIHRDVKPDNVLRMEDGRLVLTDFGLAVAPGQGTFVSGYSGAVGTPAYMAPEVSLGGDASMASDVFSLGVILHEIFFSRRPEWDTTKRGRFLKPPVDRASPRRLRQMAHLCGACLDDLAPRRPQTAMEVIRQFDRASVGRYVTVLGALRAGKWGLAAGLVLAGLATAGAFYLSRPGKDVLRPRLVGTPEDWTHTATPVIKWPGAVRCLSPSSDGKTLRVIWGSPPSPVEVSVDTGQTRPWRILPETYAYACPATSPDGRRLAFSVGASVGQVRLMLSPNPDGSEARLLTSGYLPQWHPAGQEIIYVHDSRRVGVVGDQGFSALLPEVAELDHLLSSIAVNKAGDRIATLHRAPDGGLVTIYEFPSLSLTRKYRLNTPVVSAQFAERGGLLLIHAPAEGPADLLELRADESVRRRAHMGELNFAHLAESARGLSFVTHRRWGILFGRGLDGTKRELARSGDFLRMSAPVEGNVLVEENFPGGRSVIGLYSEPSGLYRRLTDGPRHHQPVFRPDGRAFAFIDGATKDLRFCELSPELRCRPLNLGHRAWWVAGFSPSGQKLGFFSLVGSRLRLGVVLLRDGGTVDLGVISPKRCALRWSGENRLWIFHSEESRWAEIDISSRTPTGRTEAVGVHGADGCPIEDPVDSPLTAVSGRESILWQKQN